MTVGLLKDQPFATLFAVSDSHFNPDSYHSNIGYLKSQAELPEEQQPAWLRKFKYEAKEVLLGNAEGLDRESFARHVQFHDGSAEMFLRRAWAESFPTEPIPGSPVEPFDSLYTIAHIYFDSEYPDGNYVHPNYLKRHLERDEHELSPLIREIRSDLARIIQADFNGLDLVRFRSETSSYFHRREDDKGFALHTWRYLFPNEPLPEPNMTGMLDTSKPFATLTNVSEGFFHPEIYYDHINDLKEFASLPEEQQPAWLRRFRFELKEYLIGNAEGFDDERFFRTVQFHDGRTEMFLRRAWAETFPNDPIPGIPVKPFDSLYTIAHIYFGHRELGPDDYYVHPDHLKRQLERNATEQSPLLRSIKPDLTRMLNGDFEGLDLIDFRARTSSFYHHYREDDKDFARHVWNYLFPSEPLPEPEA